MKVAVIGAGVSGLSIARMLNDANHETVVFEREGKPGGLVKCQKVNNCLFHQTGGHVFNTKYQAASDWFWSLFDKETEFIKAVRNSAVILNGMNIPYPIENYIYMLDADLQKQIIRELLEINRNRDLGSNNFEEFLYKHFGTTLYEIYLKPYNSKIWGRDLKTVPMDWLEGKLPMPNVEEIFYNNFNHVKEQSFVHSSFYYPLRNGSQFIVDRLSEGLDIRLSTGIERIGKHDSYWEINNERFDSVVFCGNIKQLPDILPQNVLNEQIKERIRNLEAHGTTTVFCEIDKNDFSWLYLPDRNHKAHRIICTGNFSPNNNNGNMTATVEFTDSISHEEILENLEKIPYSPKYLAHHYEEYTYPIQDASTRLMIGDIKEMLVKDKFYLLGRFAEWEYYNMDVAINAALKLRDCFYI